MCIVACSDLHSCKKKPAFNSGFFSVVDEVSRGRVKIKTSETRSFFIEENLVLIRCIMIHTCQCAMMECHVVAMLLKYLVTCRLKTRICKRIGEPMKKSVADE